MSKHTPGPWKVHLVDGALIVDDAGWEVAEASGDYDTDADRMEANARLIAAAPDLLAALKHARSQMQHPDELIDAAIDKAEGRS